MNNTLTTASSTNTSSSSTMHLPSRTEEIAICNAIMIEAVLIVGGNLLTICLFVLEKKLRKKSLLLVMNMPFADVMLVAVSLPLYIYLRVGFRPPLWRKRVLEPLEVFLPLDWSHFLAGLLTFCSVYFLRKILRRLLATKTPNTVNKSIRHCHCFKLDTGFSK